MFTTTTDTRRGLVYTGFCPHAGMFRCPGNRLRVVVVHKIFAAGLRVCRLALPFVGRAVQWLSKSDRLVALGLRRRKKQLS